MSKDSAYSHPQTRGSVEPSPIEGGKWIPLTQRKWCLVDEEDYPALSEYNWYYKTSKTSIENGYAMGRPFGKKLKVFMHAFIMGISPKEQIDHVDGNGLNNRKDNLRPATAQQNAGNARKRTIATSSRFKGVSWDKSRAKWIATIRISYQKKNLGRFPSEEQAARAYDKAALEAFGEFAKLNFKDNP